MKTEGTASRFWLVVDKVLRCRVRRVCYLAEGIQYRT